MNTTPQLTETATGPLNVYEALNGLLQNLCSKIAEPTRVREEQLADELGVSRTPVREALIRLESTGMVRLRPGRGALLMPVTDQDYLEWLQLREQLEALASYESALNASQRDVDQLRMIFAPFAGPNALYGVDYAKANVVFHQELMRLSGNRMLERVWSSFGHLQTSYRRQTIARMGRAEISLKEHHAIIDAIEKRDAHLAEKLARAHVVELKTAVMQTLAFNNVEDSASSTRKI